VRETKNGQEQRKPITQPIDTTPGMVRYSAHVTFSGEVEVKLEITQNLDDSQVTLAAIVVEP
jgi:hypothetical protein